MHIRISVTDLDAWNYFRANDHVTVEDFLAQMRREAEPTPAMAAGSAFHRALELATAGEYQALEADGHRFNLAPDVEMALPDIREIKATKNFRFGDVTATLVGKVDALSGRTVYDHKLTKRYDPDRFLSGVQWRAYLDMFEADSFVWNVFEGGPTPERDLIDTPLTQYTVRHYHELTASRYPELADDVASAVADFVEMARLYLPERFAAEAA